MAAIVVVCVLAAAAWFFIAIPARDGGQRRVVVYCALDSMFSQAVLERFERETGIKVDVRFDTEATKSLGLIEQLVSEKDQPRCDVFWNNELLGMVDLQQRGVLQPYKGVGYERIPAGYKEADGNWTGFAARMRVWIVNTDRMAATPQAIEAALAGKLDRVAIAKPLYGTTLTHYTVLWDLWGGDRLKSWHGDWRVRGAHEATGNATVKNLVAAGVYDLGLTDTDDFFIAKDEGKPVEMLAARVDDAAGNNAARGRVICIPNTVAMIKGAPHRAEAETLIDYLLSAQTELALANSRSRQVPLGPVDESKLSDEVRQLKQWVAEGYPLTGLGEARRACLSWLKAEYVR